MSERDIVEELREYEPLDMSYATAGNLKALLERAAAEITRLRMLAGAQGGPSFRDITKDMPRRSMEEIKE